MLNSLSLRAPKTPREWENLFRMTSRVFGGKMTSFFRQSVFLEPRVYPTDTLALWLGNKPVSALQVFRRTYLLEESGNLESYKIAGIGNVATHPRHRGRGYSSRLMTEVVRRYPLKNFHASFLFTGIPDFYKRWGYHVLPLHRLSVSHKSLSRIHRAQAPGDSILIKRIYLPPSGDFSPIQNILARFLRFHHADLRSTGSGFRRSISLLKKNIRGNRLYAVETRGRVSGYFLSRKLKGSTSLSGCAFHPSVSMDIKIKTFILYFKKFIKQGILTMDSIFKPILVSIGVPFREVRETGFMAVGWNSAGLSCIRTLAKKSRKGTLQVNELDHF